MLVLMIVHLIEFEIQNQIWKWIWKLKMRNGNEQKKEKENNFSPVGPATLLLAHVPHAHSN